jgi:hypothetical protein
MFKEIIAVYSALCGQNAELLIVKVDGRPVYSYH